MYSSLILLGLFLSSLHARPSLNSETSATGAIELFAGMSLDEKPLINDVKEYGWLGAGDPWNYLKSKPNLKKPIKVNELDHYDSEHTQERNIAMWALRQANEDKLTWLCLFNGHSSEAFTALIWLIGIAEDKLQEWISMAKEWANYRGKLPQDLRRVAIFNENFVNDYGWLEESRKHGLARPEDSDVTAMAIYLGSVLFSARQAMPDKKYFYNTELIKRESSI
uniref:Hesp-570 n=1 Tax=Melampsora lini TaxID=5261 RepID=Q2MV36_MELLI|nr:hesp-570 [Melampsora lini]